MIIQKIKKSLRLSKSGNPYASVALQFEEYKDGKGNMRWIGGFGNKRTWLWKKGEDVAPTITENGKYLNFEFDDSDENRLDVYSLPATVGLTMDLIRAMIGGNNEKQQPETNQKEENEEANDVISEEDIPF